MAIKQTQTKMFDFSDTGLDFCAGSKNLFPDRFKKMLAQGYNTQTVANVVVSGNQVTLTYGTTHGYVASRVLKVSSGALAFINNGEFVIDSVTTNTVVLTVDGAPTSISGGFTTYVASLGYELVYELNHVQIYKFKHLDESNLYLRLVFQTSSTHRNSMLAAIGKSVDLVSGTLTDVNIPGDLATSVSVANSTANLRWDFSDYRTASYDNYTFQQGFSNFGNGSVVGSQYHFLIMFNAYSTSEYGYIQGFVPTSHLNYSDLNYPIVFYSANGVTSNGLSNNGTSMRAYVGLYRCILRQTSVSDDAIILKAGTISPSNFLPGSIDSFNTTVTKPIEIYLSIQGQFIGYIAGGLYQVMYSSSGLPGTTISENPSIVSDIDFNNNIVRHRIASSNATYAWLAAPVEEIKIV